MIAVDTNALLSWLMADTLPAEDAPQTAAIAAALDDEAATVFVSTVVMAELVWVMRCRAKLDRRQTAELVSRIMADPRIVVQQAKTCACYAIGDSRFVDHLIGQIVLPKGARTTLTFDRGAGRLPTFTLLATGG